MKRSIMIALAFAAPFLSACAGSKVPTTQAIVDESRATVEALKAAMASC
jgi:outer membrane lipoprotein-sorting protein